MRICHRERIKPLTFCARTPGPPASWNLPATAVSVLADHEIPHLIVGGLAVQEHGYPRVTIDVDIVVPDVLEAVEFLTASLTGPFYRVPEFQDRVEDRRNGVMIDLLPAGKVLKRGCKVPFPQPGKVAEQFQIVTLEELISLKLDSWAGSPIRRLKDKADVNELDLASQAAARPRRESRRPRALHSKPGTPCRRRNNLRLMIYDLRFGRSCPRGQ